MQNVRQEKQTLEKKLRNLTNLLFERSPDRKRDSDTVLKRNAKRKRLMTDDANENGDGDIDEASTPPSENRKEIETSGRSRITSCRKSWNGFDQSQVIRNAYNWIYRSIRCEISCHSGTVMVQ